MKQAVAAVIVFLAFMAGVVLASPPDTSMACKVSTARSYGSGVILADGYVLTAAHVVSDEVDGKTVKIPFPMIAFSDGSRKTARLEKFDKYRDLALLKTSHRLPGIRFGATPEKGDTVWVIGCSAGLYNSIKRGVVSNLGQYMAIDAIITPGDSGGPVINESGELVGISDAMLLSSGIIYSYGLAVPISTIEAFVGGR